MVRERLFVGSEAISAGALTQRDLSRCDRVYRNVYGHRGGQLTARDRAIAAWLWSGKKSVVAGSSARMASGCKDIPVDAAIVGIVDQISQD